MSARPSICYAAPGHALLGNSGTTRSMLSLAKALSRWADVTVAFRSIREPIHPDNINIIAIEPETGGAPQRKDDVAARGLNVFDHMSYLRKLSDFARQSANSYDLVFEKGWRLSGFLSAAFSQRGVPGVLVENDVRCWSEPIGSAGAIARYGAHRVAQSVAGFYSRRVPLVIAETDELKGMLVGKWGVAPKRIEVVGLGVDHDLFHPLDQTLCRKVLRIKRGAFVLLYVGGMDTYHDVGPMIEALTRLCGLSLEVHLVGDGELRSEYEVRARRALVPIRFHGQVPHNRIPEFIGAADLCLAPYRVSAFPHGSVSFSSLKIPEYMACGRPVVSVPSGHIKKLIDDRMSGFLFPNDLLSWVTFFRALPSRQKLKQMGRAAAWAVESITWEKTAERYLEVCRELTAGQSLPTKARIGFESRFRV